MKKIKNLKPVSTDIHLKYKCPQCGLEHWTSILESQTKEFIIVCACSTLLKPKIIAGINVVYADQPSARSSNQKSTLDDSQIQVALKTLIGYGFTNSEANELIKNTMLSKKISDTSDLIKTCLSNFGAIK